MKNYIYFPISLFILMISCKQNDNQSKIILETTGYADSTKIYLVHLETVTKDSGYIINNNLTFYVDIDEPTKFQIMPVWKKRERPDLKSFWKENKLLTIRVEKGNMKNATIEGSEIQLQADAVDWKNRPA